MHYFFLSIDSLYKEELYPDLHFNDNVRIKSEITIGEINKENNPVQAVGTSPTSNTSTHKNHRKI